VLIGGVAERVLAVSVKNGVQPLLQGRRYHGGDQEFRAPAPAIGCVGVYLIDHEGVVAFVGPTGETTSSEQMDMALAVQTALVEGDTIGRALLKGWWAATTADSRQGFALLGDPALRPMPVIADGSDG